MKHVLIGLFAATLMNGATASAHPHEDTPEEPVKKIWPYFGNDTDSRTTLKAKDKKLEVLSELDQRMKKHGERIRKDAMRAKEKNKHAFANLKDMESLDDADNIREAAKALEAMFEDSDIFENMADMMLDLAEDFDFENGEDGMSFSFDGKTLGRLKQKPEGKMNESFELEGLGKNMVVDKETYFEDGKKRTRIVIEMDADEDLD